MQNMAEHYLQKGIEEGKRRMSIESTLNVLTERFPSADVNVLKSMLEAVGDLDRLKQLNLNAAIAKSFDAFQEALNAEGTK